jgi:hypothetical protein
MSARTARAARPLAGAATAIQPPVAVTAPVVAPDVAFSHQIISMRDSAVVAGQSLQNDRAAREEYYEREQARLCAARDAEMGSLDLQIRQQANILIGCDAALAAIGTSNVVPLKHTA